MKKNKWTQLALFDLEEILTFISQENEDASLSIAQKIEHSVGLPSEYPSLGKVTSKKNIRELAIPQIPYSIPYKIQENTIHILRVLHDAQEERYSFHFYQ